MRAMYLFYTEFLKASANKVIMIVEFKRVIVHDDDNWLAARHLSEVRNHRYFGSNRASIGDAAIV